mmetsp:Transcript_27178/g.48793  ORF Transcript_27178/g.48793 Transcript_27178/m.48793 type:complete len:211 (+) Transcript_27178:1496-2128(+)
MIMFFVSKGTTLRVRKTSKKGIFMFWLLYSSMAQHPLQNTIPSGSQMHAPQQSLRPSIWRLVSKYKHPAKKLRTFQRLKPIISSPVMQNDLIAGKGVIEPNPKAITPTAETLNIEVPAYSKPNANFLSRSGSSSLGTSNFSTDLTKNVQSRITRIPSMKDKAAEAPENFIPAYPVSPIDISRVMKKQTTIARASGSLQNTGWNRPIMKIA